METRLHEIKYKLKHDLLECGARYSLNSEMHGALYFIDASIVNLSFAFHVLAYSSTDKMKAS